MTDLEAGQELIKVADALSDAASELRKTHPDLADVLTKLRTKVAKEFNDRKTHEFGL